MSRNRVFQPVIATYLQTDGANHSDTIEFKISYGYEIENPNPVFKVQMVGDGKIKGRQAPSYSDGDFDKIVEIKSQLKKEFDKTDKRVRDGEFEIPGVTTAESKFL
ncbi:hypothetical protein [Companilactobacillus kimchiensis]|uniref:Uncharacterized protein n=1 Tax=Companilactobacillus kimchiensis TaxID=993692 RepID=A0A0R2LA55_9LACO|nr:hypothetical protein [Companilactobacillus kimchiensis]KRN98729.1 hypothetical protein IV57_GL000841 [Companilactobacillus kimchiensis]